MEQCNKKIYAPSVFMTEQEYEKLVDRFGEEGTIDRIERLSLYKNSKGKKYKCDYSTILSWARRDDQKPPEPQINTSPVPPYLRTYSLEEDMRRAEADKKAGRL